MEIVFVVLGRFDYTVLLGNLLGGGWAILNFFLMALAVQKSVKKDLPQEAKLVLQNSYTRRLLLSVAILLIGIKVEYFNWISVVIPLIFIPLAVLVGVRGANLLALALAWETPVAVSSYIMAQQAGADGELAGQLVVLSSVCCIPTVFLMIFILQSLALL